VVARSHPGRRRPAAAALLRSPPFTLEWLREIDADHLVYESIKPGPGGSVSVMLTPLDLIECAAAQIPPPRQHRHRFYGLLAPCALLRSQLRPVSAEEQPPKRSNLGLPRRLLLAVSCRHQCTFGTISRNRRHTAAMITIEASSAFG
jgi:hypothetical protein